MDIFVVNGGPSDFWTPAKPVHNALYKNNRDGTFTDVAVQPGSAALGVAVGDSDNDGFPDLFVKAYGRPVLYHNNGDGTFTDVSENSGLVGLPVFDDATDEEIQAAIVIEIEPYGAGAPTGKRVGQVRHGGECGGFYNDVWQDLFVANVDQEIFSLYKNNKNESFSDVAHKQGIAPAKRLLSGWGLKFFD